MLPWSAPVPLSVSPLEVTQPRFVCYSSDMVLLEKRETRQFSLSVRGLKARGPAESSNLINERVNYAQITDVDFWEHAGRISNYNYDRSASGEILRGGRMEGSKRCGFAARSLLSETERVGAVWIEYRDQSQSG